VTVAETPFLTTVRQLTAAKLLAGGLMAGENVHVSRRVPLDDVTDLPAVAVYTLSSRGERIADAPPMFRHTADLTVELAFDATAACPTDEPLDDVVDRQCDLVAVALLESAEWVAQFERVSSWDRTDQLINTGRRRMHLVQIRASVEYATIHEPIVTDDLATARVEIDLHPADGRIEAGADIVVPTD
jgi:hypothetical protein